MEFLQRVTDELKNIGKMPMDVGDEQAFILDDGVVVVGMDEGRELRIQVCLNPIRLEGVKSGFGANG